jgi:hypothetical protein
MVGVLNGPKAAYLDQLAAGAIAPSAFVEPGSSRSVDNLDSIQIQSGSFCFSGIDRQLHIPLSPL